MRGIAIYARVSDAETTEKSSVPDQLRDARKFSDARWPAHPIYEFSEVESATIQNRPELCKLIALVQTGGVSAIVIRDQDRLSRDTIETLSLHRELTRLGVEIWLYRTGQQLASNDPHAKFTLSMMASVSQLECEMTAIRTKARMVSMRNNGEWNGGHTPKGYTARDGVFVHTADAPAVKKIFETAAETRSLAEAFAIAREFGLWRNKQSVQYALKNRVYLGEWHKPDGTWIKDHHEPIVSADLFDQAQGIARLPWSTKRRTTDRVFILQGMLRCAHCGRFLTTCHTNKNGMKFFYYECTAKLKECPVKRLPAADAEEYCWSALTRELSNPKTLKDALDEYERIYSTVNQDAVAEMEKAKHRLRTLDLKKKSILAGFEPYYATGAAIPVILTHELLSIEQEQPRVEKAMLEAKQRAQPKAKIDAEAYLRGMRRVFCAKNLEPQDRRAVMQSVVGG